MRIGGYPALAAVLILLPGLLLGAWGFREATAAPVERRAAVVLADWPAGHPPLRIALLSDIHVGGPDMPPARLARIVEQVNARRPDLVLIAGDLVSDKRFGTRRYGAAEAVAPLAELRAPLGVVAVLGNHDHWRGAAGFRAALPRAGVVLLSNRAVRRGPLVVAGIDDAFTGHDDIAAAARSASALPGPAVALSHSPDVASRLPPRFGLLLAGHSHCEQIVLPLIGPLTRMSRHGCGLSRAEGRTILVTAGLGTSILPLRIGAPPDYWMVTVGPGDGAGRAAPGR